MRNIATTETEVSAKGKATCRFPNGLQVASQKTKSIQLVVEVALKQGPVSVTFVEHDSLFSQN